MKTARDNAEKIKEISGANPQKRTFSSREN